MQVHIHWPTPTRSCLAHLYNCAGSPPGKVLGAGRNICKGYGVIRVLPGPQATKVLSWTVHSVPSGKESQDMDAEGGLWSNMASTHRSVLNSLAVVPP